MTCRLFPPNTPLRTKIGVAVTAVYLFGLISLIYWKRAELNGLKLNELGDFAAGAFGPLAFLWLVIGYMQQGDELKQNTDALRLQANELANTVEQQKELVELGYAQLEREKEIANEERSRQIAAARPKFEFSIPYGASETDDWIELMININNVGPACTHLKVSADTQGVTCIIEKYPTKNQSWKIISRGIASEPFETFDLTLIYVDVAGNMGTQAVFVNYYEDEDTYGHHVYGEDDQRLMAMRLKKKSEIKAPN